MNWNGYGLSFWRCACGAARSVTGLVVRGERIVEVRSKPCKRCGSKAEPVGWPYDPWAGFET
jgi:hypothetical protein